MEHKSLGVREERRALFLGFFLGKEKGKGVSSLFCFFWCSCKEGRKGKREALGKTSQPASTQLSNGHTPLSSLQADTRALKLPQSNGTKRRKHELKRERTIEQQNSFPTALWARAQDNQWRGENMQRQQRLPCFSSKERCGRSCSSSLHACSCGPHELALSLAQSQMHACKSKAKSHDKQGPDNSTCMHSPKIAARTQLQLPRAHTTQQFRDWHK